MGRAARAKRGRNALTAQGIDILSLPTDILLEVITSLCKADKTQLRLVCKRLRDVTSSTIHHLTLDEAQHAELTGPSRRSALCLQLAARLPALTSCTFTTIYGGPVSLMPRLLKQLRGLTRLDCYQARPAPLVIHQLTSCISLRELYIDTTLSKTLAPLPPLPALTTLRINLHPLSLLPPSLCTLAHYPALQTLTLDTMSTAYPTTPYAADLTPLSALPLLSSLTLSWFNGLLSASLSHLTTLTCLTLSGTGATELTTNSILHLTSLASLSLLAQYTPNPPPKSWLNGPPSTHKLPTPLPPRPTFPHLTSLRAPAYLLARPLCPRAPALHHLTTTFSRHDADPALLPTLLPPLPLTHLTHFTCTIDGNNRAAMLALLAHLPTAAPHLSSLALNGPFPLEAVPGVAALKALRDFTLDTRVLTTTEEKHLKAALEGLRVGCPELLVTFAIHLPPSYIWFWEMLQFL